MIWFTLFLFAASFFLSVLLAPKPNLEDARPGKMGDIRFPRADEGAPIPLVFGRVRIRAPNVLWYGDFATRAIKEEVKTGVFSSEDVTVGYKYYIGLDLALGLGPGMKIHKIWVEKKILWGSGVGGGPGAYLIPIYQPTIFGGSKKGGGFTGSAYFYGGEFDQIRSGYLETQLGADVPAYRGTAHIVFLRVYIGTSPQLRPLSFEVSRYPDNLGLDPSDNIIGEDLNPMEILYTLLTEGWGGVGMDSSYLDTASFTSAAETLATEGNGMSLTVMNANEAKEVVTEILRQVDGVLYQDPTTGKIMVKLIRDDYVIESLPVFDESNVTKLKDYSRSAWAETTNQVRVKFNYRDKNYEPAAALVQDMANINQQGRIRSATLSFPGVTEPLLATTLSTRELSQRSVPLFRATATANREATQLRPGSPFVLSWSDYGIESEVMRVKNFDLGELLQGRVVMNVAQDKFASANVLFTEPEDTLWDPVDRPAVDLTDFLVFECPYWIVERVSNMDKPADSSWLWGLARRPSDALYLQGYEFVVSDDNFVLDKIVEVTEADYPLSAELDGALYAEMGQPTGEITKIKIKNVDPDDTWGDPFDAATQADIRDDGRNMFVINGELFAFEDYTDLGGNEYELLDVHRALLDTQYEDHADGDIVYFLFSKDWMSRNDRDDNDQLWYKFLSFSDQDYQEEGDVLASTINTNQRYNRPLPPDMVELESTRCPIEIVGQTTVQITDFLERNRLTPDQVVLVDDGTDTPEATTTYNARFLLDGVTIEEQTGLTIASLPITFGSGTALNGAGVGRIEIEAVRDTLISWEEDFDEFYFAAYANLSAELVTEGDFESGLGSWTEPSGDWDDENTVYPLSPCVPVGSPGDSEHAESKDSGTNELQQSVSVTAYQGQAAVLRAYRGGLTAGVQSQIKVELRDTPIPGTVYTITTPLEEASGLGKWDLVEIPLPIRSDANYARITLIANGAGAAFDNVSLKANTVSPTSATQYDSIGGLTVVGAWGLRLMDSSYGGPLVRIRDTHDDSEQDLDPDIDGNLEPFYVKGEARVVTLYDQSGNGADLEAESASEQPRLRGMSTATGRPCIDFEGGTEALLDTVASTSRPYMVTRPNCCFAVGPKETTGNDYILTIPHDDGVHTTPYARWGMTTGATDWRIMVNGALSADPGNGPSNGPQMNVWVLDYFNGESYHNEDTTTVKSWTPADITYPNDTRLRIGESGNGTLEWDGDFHELCIYTGDISAANRKTFMESIADYWYALSI